MTRLFLLLTLWAFLAAPLPATAAPPDDSVVQVFATIRYPNPIRPWTRGNPVETQGSGTVIDGNRILTNAHLVLYASDVQVQPRRGGDKTEARVEAIAPDMDLALLSVKDEKFFRDRPALPRAANLPRIQDAVAVYGFPIGGSGMAVTRGEVSRIAFMGYYQEGMGLTIQVSAAINPGNSGGPAVVNDKMIGVVFSRLRAGENIGYIIPNAEIDAFLQDIKDGCYDGKPREAAGTGFQTLQNRGLRSFLKLDDRVKGIMVRPPRHLPAGYPFQEFDVLTRIGEHDIDNEGMVQRPGDLRVSFYSLIPTLARNGAVPVTLLRRGKRLEGALPVTRQDNRLIRNYAGEKPSYFIHGPLVFSPARAGAINFYTRLNPALYVNESPLLARQFDRVAFPGEELVVVTSPMFAHKIAKGYGDPVGQVVREVNSIKIKNLRHLVEVLRDSSDEHLTFRFAEEGTEILIFRRQEMDEATTEILEDNGIAPTRRGSEDMLEVWKRKKGPAPR
jgi:S1-C subfamily serine protease